MAFQPQIISALKENRPATLVKEFMAGVLVGIIAIPLSIALSIASGASPKEGLITAAVAGFVAALLGGSRVQVTGPTGAFVVIVYGIIASYGMTGLIAATIMAGIILILMGVFRLGSLVKFIPLPLISGFTSGIAIVIFSGQVKDLLGLNIGALPAEFTQKCVLYTQSINSVNLYAVLIAAISLAIMLVMPKLTRVIPGSLAAIFVATALMLVFKLPVDTIGSNYPSLTGSIPRPSFPVLKLNEYIALLRPAFTIAILGAIESLLSAVVADKMIGEKNDSDTELIAQGAANIFSGIFGGLPATGAIARTAANIDNGGRTPIAGMVHAVFVLFISLVLLPFAKLIPMPTLAAILLTVCFNMFGWDDFRRIRRAPKSDTLLMLVTLTLTVVFDLIIAIEVGLLLAVVLFVKRMSQESTVRSIPSKEYDNIAVYHFSGPLFFGNSELFEKIHKNLSGDIKFIMLDMKHVNSIDFTVINALEEFIDSVYAEEVTVYVVQLQKQPLAALKKAKINDMKNCVFMKQMEKALWDAMESDDGAVKSKQMVIR